MPFVVKPNLEGCPVILPKRKKEKEKSEKIEHMKQGLAENMTIAVLKQLLKDKGIALSRALSSKAKKGTCKKN